MTRSALRDQLNRIEEKLDAVLANLPLYRRAAGDVALRQEAARRAARERRSLMRVARGTARGAEGA